MNQLNKTIEDLADAIAGLLPGSACSGCGAILGLYPSEDGPPEIRAKHKPDCPVARVVEAFKVHVKEVEETLPAAGLNAPAKMPVQGIYANAIILLVLTNALLNSGKPAAKIDPVLKRISDTVRAMLPMLKGHMPGRSIIDEVLAVLEDGDSEEEAPRVD